MTAAILSGKLCVHGYSELFLRFLFLLYTGEGTEVPELISLSHFLPSPSGRCFCFFFITSLMSTARHILPFPQSPEASSIALNSQPLESNKIITAEEKKFTRRINSLLRQQDSKRPGLPLELSIYDASEERTNTVNLYSAEEFTQYADKMGISVDVLLEAARNTQPKRKKELL